MKRRMEELSKNNQELIEARRIAESSVRAKSDFLAAMSHEIRIRSTQKSLSSIKRYSREAVLKELHRGGQVYIVNDRVENIDSFAATLQESIPEARFLAAHGQLKGHELEKVMLDFLEKKCDVLVATKIIESGLDIPNVNTIIINRADRFGLAELNYLVRPRRPFEMYRHIPICLSRLFRSFRRRLSGGCRRSRNSRN